MRNIPGKVNAADGPSRGTQIEHLEKMEPLGRGEIVGGNISRTPRILKVEPVDVIEAQIAVMDYVEDILEWHVDPDS